MTKLICCLVNFISKIELDNREVLTSEEGIVREIVGFFKTLYSQRIPEFRGFIGVDWEGISSFSSAWHERPFTEEEIKEAVFQCDRGKALGPDGFSMAVFQTQ